MITRLVIAPPLATLVLALTACSSGDSSGSPTTAGDGSSTGDPAPLSDGQMRLDAADVEGTTDEPARVTVAGEADGDGTADTAFTVRLQLTDPGHTGTQAHEWEIVAIDTAGNDRRQRIAVVLNP